MENENYLRTLKEGLRIELKESGKKIPDSLYDTYSSFSNTEGGTIYLGIKEGKLNTIVGISNPEEQKKALISTLHSKKPVTVPFPMKMCKLLMLTERKSFVLS